MADLIDMSDFKKDDTRAALEALKRNMADLSEYVSLLARLRFDTYQAHLAAGFTEEQALELCKSLQL